MRRIRLSLARRYLIRLCLAILLFVCALTAHAQGCSMCRDTTASSAPQIRAGLRRAIPVLAIPAIGLFLSFLVVANRMSSWRNTDGACHGAPSQQPIDGQSK